MNNIMKPTGVIRRMDDLGRVIIPKEVRRRAHFEERDPLEFFIYDGGVLVKKYQQEDHEKGGTTTQPKSRARADLEALSLGRFLLAEVPWRVREIHDHAALSEDEVTELAWRLWDVCLNYDTIDQCIEDYLSEK